MTDLDLRNHSAASTEAAAGFADPYQVWYKIPRGRTRFPDSTGVFVCTMPTLADAIEGAAWVLGGYVRRPDGAVLTPEGQWVQPG